MSRFNERKKEEGRKAPSPVMHQTGARQLRSRVRWRTPARGTMGPVPDPTASASLVVSGTGVCVPGSRGTRDRLEGKPDKYVVGFSSACVCAALELIFTLLLLLFKTQLGSSQTVVNARNYALRLLMLVTLLLLRIGFSPLFWRLFWSILSICSSRLIWSLRLL